MVDRSNQRVGYNPLEGRMGTPVLSRCANYCARILPEGCMEPNRLDVP